jgi:hypothetical protein
LQQGSHREDMPACDVIAWSIDLAVCFAMLARIVIVTMGPGWPEQGSIASSVKQRQSSANTREPDEFAACRIP